jgi:peptidoglycan/xylan/chitin deacetylase (PgdA/CDA1 family)
MKHHGSLTTILLLLAVTGIAQAQTKWGVSWATPQRLVEPGNAFALDPSPAGYNAMADAIPLSLFASGLPHATAPQMALTFDDLPAHGSLPPGETRVEVISKFVGALQHANVPSAYGFVNGNWLETHPEDLRALQIWRDAGYPLGNHAWSHMNLNDHTLEEFEADVTRNEPLLSKWKDNDWHWFRFPFLAEGDTPEKRAGVRAFLLQHGYKVGGVTMSFADYLWTEPYARCRAKGDTQAVALLEKSYLAAVEENIGYYRSMSQTLLGRDIPYVLLMHVSALGAEMMPRVLDLYRAKGFQFVTLEEAERDPFYLQSTDLHRPPAADNLEGALAERHLALPPHTEPSIQFDSLCR